MKITRKFVSLLTAAVMIVSMIPHTFAYDLTEFYENYSCIEEEKYRRIQEITQSPNSSDWLGVVVENLPLNNDVSFYPTCLDCSWFTVDVCAGESTLYDEVYHYGGFLGMFLTDCYAYYFSSRAAEICPGCYNVLHVYESHYCYEVHMKCSKGEYDTCPFDGNIYGDHDGNLDD